MTTFNKGDVVQLKSGGERMTIKDIGDYGPTGPEDGVLCSWFEGKKIHEHVFDAAQLEYPPSLSSYIPPHMRR